MADPDPSNLTTLTVNLLSAYVANNNVEHSAIPDLIKTTHAALKAIDTDAPAEPDKPEFEPAVTLRKSLASKTHIVSMIDGKPYQTLKRHLSTHGLTPQQYRERYGLPKTYPMVAPAYSESRREIAIKLGLGNRRKAGQTEAAAPVENDGAERPTPSADAPAAKKVGRPKGPKTAAAKADVAVPAKANSAPKTKAKASPKPNSDTTAGPVDTPAAAVPATPPRTPRKTAATSIAPPNGNEDGAAKPRGRKRAEQPTEPVA